MPSMSVAASGIVSSTPLQPPLKILSSIRMDPVSQTGTAVSRIAAMAFKDSRTAAFSVGVGTVIATHSIMLVLPPGDEAGRNNHALINLAAAAAIVYGSRVFG